MSAEAAQDTHISFPPLMSGEETSGNALELATLRATAGCDAGLVTYRVRPNDLQAALVFAPEVPLAEAMAMLPLCAVGFQNALGALAPPEVSVHLGWDGPILVNGAYCGRFDVAASDTDPAQVPDWLAVGLQLDLVPDTDRPGDTPDRTWLYAEGCVDVLPHRLIEAWARHTLNWITRWEDEGTRPLHATWRGLAQGIGEPVTRGPLNGTFLGVDEQFGMLLRDDDTTHLIPLTALLEDTP